MSVYGSILRAREKVRLRRMRRVEKVRGSEKWSRSIFALDGLPTRSLPINLVSKCFSLICMRLFFFFFFFFFPPPVDKVYTPTSPYSRNHKKKGKERKKRRSQTPTINQSTKPTSQPGTRTSQKNALPSPSTLSLSLSLSLSVSKPSQTKLVKAKSP